MVKIILKDSDLNVVIEKEINVDEMYVKYQHKYYYFEDEYDDNDTTIKEFILTYDINEGEDIYELKD